MKKIFIATSTFCEFSNTPIKLLRQNGFELIFNNKKKRVSSKDLSKQIHRFDGIIAGTEVYNSNILNRAKILKVISRVGVGMDNVNLKYADERNIKVFKTQTNPALAVGELVICLILSLTRKVYSQSEELKKDME